MRAIRLGQPRAVDESEEGGGRGAGLTLRSGLIQRRRVQILHRRIVPHIRMLDVLCKRCPRHGRLSVARLVREMGEDAPIWKAWEGLNADCRLKDKLAPGKACSLYAPDLVKLPPRA